MVPLQVPSSAARLCSGGSPRQGFPPSQLLFGPRTPGDPSAPTTVSLPGAYLGRALVLNRGSPAPAYAPSLGFSLGSPAACSARKSPGLPGFWVILLRRAVVTRPVGCARPSPWRARRFCFQSREPLEHPRSTPFSRLDFPRPIRSPAYASSATLPRRRKTSSRLVGYSLAGRDSHPLDDERDFGRYRIASSFSTSLAWSHLSTGAYFCGGSNCS